MISARVFIADPRPIVRLGVATFLEQAGADWVVCGMSGDVGETVRQLASEKPDLVILGDARPAFDGLAAAAAIRRAAPKVKVLLIIEALCPRALLEAYSSPVAGCLLKDAPLAELLLALETVRRGHRFRSACLVDLCAGIEEAGAARVHLTPRELETLRELVDGLTTKEIATKRGLSVVTIDTHRTHLRHKLHLHSTAELVSYAWRSGLAGP